MSEPMLVCPHCSKEFPITEAATHQLKEYLLKTTQEDSIRTIKELQNQLDSEKEKRKAAEEVELTFRKEQQKLKDEQDEWELKKQREIDAERDVIREKALANFIEAQQIKDREKDELIKSLQEKITDLDLKARQGSQQAQGEALELVVEDILRRNFPFDKIIPVPKGVNGADVLQQVYNELGQHCGTIIWETKRTKSWGNEWCSKLKEDRQTARADVAILVSQVLPATVKDFGLEEGVWVTQFHYTLGLCTAIRVGLMDMHVLKRASEDKGTKIEDMYNYLTSPNFSQRLKAIIEYFNDMKKDLETEKRAIQKQWKKRETQIENVTKKTIEIRGELEAIIGRSILQIDDVEQLALTEWIEVELEEEV